MKTRILEKLNSRDCILSGETISNQLGVSRVSVWKHIKGLQKMGYPIVSTSKGYRLEGDADTLLPWDFPGREKTIHFFPELSSTMDKAMEMAGKQCPDFTVIVAERQKNGRGRLRRTWLSSEGGLYFTVVTRPRIPAVLSAKVNFSAAVELATVLRDLFDIDAMVKWPNDVLVNGAKISGILSQMEAETDQVNFINIGVGININNDPANIEPKAVSVRKLLERPIPRKIVLSAFLDAFEEKMAILEDLDVIDQWKRINTTIGRRVKISTHKEQFEGVAKDVDDNGALVLELADGTKRTVVYGDCFLI